MILDRQTNKVFVSEKTLEYFPTETNHIFECLANQGVLVKYLPFTKEGWCRDYMPIQVSKTKFVQYRYWPDYMRNIVDMPYITDPSETLSWLGIETVKTTLIIDGGNVIKCPDCVIMVDKIFKENPDWTRTQVIEELECLFECEILFLPWDRAEKYGHADGIVRYIRDNKVLMTNYSQIDARFADKFRKALSKKFEVVELHYDVERPHKYNWSYINFLQMRDLIAIPSFNEPEDQQALAQIKDCFKDYRCKVITIPMKEIVKAGGALNCISWTITSWVLPNYL